MRTYLIDADKNEVVFNLTKTIKHDSNLVEFEYTATENGEEKARQTVFIRRLAGNYFASVDNQSWRKVARQNIPKRILNVDRVFDLYRGFKPSGLSGGGEGELLTQMPGKIVKILVKEGDVVEEGQTLLILEAMKMENEIKAGVGGTLKTIHVKEGDALDSGVLMMEIEA